MLESIGLQKRSSFIYYCESYFSADFHILIEIMREVEKHMAYIHSKGWYISQLKGMGITKHPVDLRKLELYKTYVVRKLYFAAVNK